MTTNELPIKNPYKKKSDYIPARIKVFWKTFIAPIFGHPHHQIIIPETKKHPAWILGAQPSKYTIKKLLKENSNRSIHIISMLTNAEQIITNQDPLIKQGKIKITRTPWHDHSILNLTTSKNQTAQEMIELQKKLHQEFNKKPITEAFYCHCMAGKARSLITTLTFIYLYPNKNILFDFANWPKKIVEKIPEELQKRLADNPSFKDIAQFVKIRRPNVKSLTTLENDQASLLKGVSI